MSIFHRDLDAQIHHIAEGMKRKAMIIPDNWHWLDYKTKREAIQIEEMDALLMKKLNMLHHQGKDEPLLTSRIIMLSNELMDHLEDIKKERNIPENSNEGKRIKAILAEISEIFSRELAMMHHESMKLLFENSMVSHFKARIIDCLIQKEVKWHEVSSHIYHLLITKSSWQSFTKGQRDMFKLVGKGAEYESRYNGYKKYIDAIEKVYEGADPLKYEEIMNNLKFNRGIEKSFTSLCLSQLFMIEQDLNYTFGKVNPPRAYLMGYIRMIRLGVDELDKLLWNSTRHPPRMMFRSKECLLQNTL